MLLQDNWSQDTWVEETHSLCKMGLALAAKVRGRWEGREAGKLRMLVKWWRGLTWWEHRTEGTEACKRVLGALMKGLQFWGEAMTLSLFGNRGMTEGFLSRAVSDTMPEIVNAQRGGKLSEWLIRTILPKVISTFTGQTLWEVYPDIVGGVFMKFPFCQDQVCCPFPPHPCHLLISASAEPAAIGTCS